jgi:hypothetical protein
LRAPTYIRCAVPDHIGTAAVIHVAGPRSIQFAWRTHFVGHLRAINNNLLDTYQLKSQHAVIDAHVDTIRKDGNKYLVGFRFVRADERQKNIAYDRVIACTGFRWDASIFAANSRPELTLDDRFPAQTSAWESVNLPGLYFAGTITQPRDYKVSTSAFVHGFRYNVRALHRILEAKNHDNPWPATPLAPEPEKLMEAVVVRVNRTSALWQQFGFLGDVIVLAEDGEIARYYEEMPVDYVKDSEVGKGGAYFVVTLEYGPDHRVSAEKQRWLLRARSHLQAAGLKTPKAAHSVQRLTTLARMTAEGADAYLLEALALCDRMERRLSEELKLIEATIHQEVKANEAVQLLMTSPSVGERVAVMLAAWIGEVTRFANARLLASYVGWVPSVHQSGATLQLGGITKAGTAPLRAVLVQAAQVLMFRCRTAESEPLRAVAMRVHTTRKRRKIAMVAAARHILRVAYNVLRDKTPYDPSKLKTASAGVEEERATRGCHRPASNEGAVGRSGSNGARGHRR